MVAGIHPRSASLTATNGPNPISRAARKKFSQSSACRLSLWGRGACELLVPMGIPRPVACGTCRRGNTVTVS